GERGERGVDGYNVRIHGAAAEVELAEDREATEWIQQGDRGGHARAGVIAAQRNVGAGLCRFSRRKLNTALCKLTTALNTAWPGNRVMHWVGSDYDNVAINSLLAKGVLGRRSVVLTYVEGIIAIAHQ